MHTKSHWEQIYTTKAADAVSWYQPHATLSRQLIRAIAQDKSARILDVGGGTSTLVDNLVQCSGLPVVRYAPDALHAEFGDTFELLEHLSEDHHTPMGVIQHFVYCHCVMH